MDMPAVQSFCLFPTNAFHKTNRRQKVQSTVTITTESFVIVQAPSVKQRQRPPSPSISKKTSRRQSKSSQTLRKLEKEDILAIDERIKENFIKDRESIPHLEERGKQLKWILENGETVFERNKARRALYKLTQNVRNIRNRTKQIEYEKLSRPILEEYKKYIQNTKVLCFIRTSETGGDEQKKRELREKYLVIASRFIDIDPSLFENVKIEVNRCSNCDSIDFFAIDESTLICSVCGVNKDRVNLNLNYKDTERINLVPRFNYTRRGHMNEALQKFQGKQNTTIPDQVIEMIKTEMIKNNISNDNLTKRHIYLFLSQNELGDQYENINLIHHLITGKPCPDLSQYETQILSMNDQIEEVYSTVKDNCRKNSLNVYYKLWKICEVLCLVMDREDFSFLKTMLKIKEHDDVCEIIFKQLGWEFEETNL